MKIKKSPLLCLIISLLSAIIAIGVAEIGLKIFGPKYYRFNNRSEEYYTNPRHYYDLIKTEDNHNVYGLRYTLNSEGYRIPSYPEPIEIPQKHVLGLGDSFTYGRGVRYEDLYLTRLERFLNQGQKKVEVKNCGEVGADINGIFNTYKRESAKFPEGALVIYGFVLNDFGLMDTKPIKGLDFIDINNGGNEFNKFRKYSSIINLFFHCIEKWQISTNTINAYLNQFKDDNAKDKFAILKKLNQTIISDNGVLIVVIFPLLYDFEHYKFYPIHEKIKSFCRENKILTLDLLPSFSKYKAEELWANYTDHHPNELAHRIAADEIYLFLKKELSVSEDKQLTRKSRQ